MYECIRKYCEDNESHGLFIMNMPTGFGKTYASKEYIYDFCMDKKNNGKKIFFITTQKKNLPIEPLRKKFEDNGKLPEFNEKFIFLDNAVDTVINNFSYDIDNDIPRNIKKSDEYKKFKMDVEFLSNAKRQHLDNNHISAVRDNFRRNNLKPFLKKIKNILFKEYKTISQRIYAIKTDKKWQWLGKLYPAVFTSKRQIIFMSVDKFLYPNDTLVERSYSFYSSSIINDSIIFIDEFDATKETLLKYIINDNLHNKIDYIDLFKDIYSAFKISDFHKDLTTPSKKNLERNYNGESLQRNIKQTSQKAENIYKTYSLNFSHKTEIEECYSKNFLFHDHRYISILDNKKKYIVTECDKSLQINKIKFTSEKPTLNENNINRLIGTIQGFIHWFSKFVRILAINYCQLRNERKHDNEDEYTLELAIRSVLSQFRLNDDYANYITSHILIDTHKSNINGDDNDLDLDFSLYENGFNYYAFEDASTHALQSKIVMCSFQNTPEKLLLKICSNAKVIGISATSAIPSVLGNYSLDYLKSKLGSYLKFIDKDNLTRLKMRFDSEQKGYENVNIHTKLLGGNNTRMYSESTWLSVFTGENSWDMAKYIYDILQREQNDSKDKNFYNRQRYLRIALAYREFILHEDIKSFLCVLTKHPKSNDSALNFDTLCKIFETISKHYKVEYNQNSIHRLDSEEFNTKKDDILQRLSNGEKLFVISVYQTIGAGQNLQYTVPKGMHDKLIKINNYPDRNEKDFDAIYLDRPTNLIVNINTDFLDEDSFIKYLFQMEFLQENAEISQQQAMQNIKYAFQKMFEYGYAENYVGIPKCKSLQLFATKTIIQAIGRICRTNLKQPNIYIYADSSIAEYIDTSIINDKIFNKEFLALANAIKKYEIPMPESSPENKAELISRRANRHINSVLSNEWTDKTMTEWQKLRALCLKKPTMSKKDIENDFIASQLYIELPCKSNVLYYNQENDFGQIKVSFTPTTYAKSEVSAIASRLDRILSYGNLRQTFENDGLATNFLPNDYILCPPIWNNIYKGALGEYVGWHLFNSVLGVELSEIVETEIFELFDYAVPDSNIYVDFKHWQDSTKFNEDIMIEKICQKAKLCASKCVIIANILSDNYFNPTVKNIDGVKIIECPSLLKPIEGTEILELNEKSWEIIRRALYEYGNQDQ